MHAAALPAPRVLIEAARSRRTRFVLLAVVPAVCLAVAYTNGTELQVWYQGMVITVSTTLLRTPLADEKKLAAAAIAAIDRAAAAT